MRDYLLNVMKLYSFKLQDETMKVKTAGKIHPMDKEFHGSGITLREMFKQCKEEELQAKFVIQWLQEMKFDEANSESSV